MPSIIIQNVSSGPLSLDIPVPGGGIGVGHPKAIRALLGRTESVEIGDAISVDDLNRSQEFQDLLAAGLILVTANLESSDVALPESLTAGGWQDTGVLVRLGTATDSVSIGAAALEGTEKLRLVHTGALLAALESTSAGAVGVTLATYHNSASPAASDVVARFSHFGEDDGGGKTEYVRVEARALAVTAGTEVGSYAVAVQDALGNLTDCMWVNYSGVTLTGYISGTVGPELSLFSSKAAGADGDTVGAVGFYGNDDSPATEIWGSIATRIVDASDTTEEAIFALSLLTAGAFTADILTVSGSTTEIRSVSAGALGPTLSLHHDSASPADNDVIGRISFFGEADAGVPTKTEMGRMQVVVNDVSDTTEDATFSLNLIAAGTLPSANLETLTVNNLSLSYRGALGPTSGPELSISFRKGAAGANGDIAGFIGFYANDDASALNEVAYWTCTVPDAGAATLDAAMSLNMMVNNVDTVVLNIGVGGGLGVWGHAAPAAQPAKITDPAGGGTVDAEARTAINAIIDVLEGAGLSAAV